jgi:uncharacterized protein involved in exopolysaccharide biosynthesis
MDQNEEQSPVNSHQTVPDVGLIDYLQVIVKRRRMIFKVTLAAAVISIVISILLPNIYTAKTMILPAQEDKGLANAMMGQLGGLAVLAGESGSSIGGPTKADLYVSMMKSEAVKDPIIDRFKLMEVYKNKYRMDAYKKIDQNVLISSGKKDGIITVAVDDKDPKRAADMANAYVEELGKLAIRMNVTGAGQNRNFLEERLAMARGDLAKAEEKLKAFQSKNKAVQVTTQAQATIQGIAALRAQLASNEVQLATYRLRYTESSQEVKNLVTMVSNLKSQIAKLEGAGENSSIPSVGSVPAIREEYIRLMREFKIQESLVELLTKQYEMASLNEAKDVFPFQVILKAKAPERKSKPLRALIVISATFAAFSFSFLLAFVRENFARMPEENIKRWKSLCVGLPFPKTPKATER